MSRYRYGLDPETGYDLDADREAAEDDAALEQEQAESSIPLAIRVLGVQKVRALVEAYASAPLAGEDTSEPVDLWDWVIPF